jgi:hypothetical protein
MHELMAAHVAHMYVCPPKYHLKELIDFREIGCNVV